jgi:hypothetical protein
MRKRRRQAAERAKPKETAPALSPTEVQQLKLLVPLVPFVPTLVKMCREYEAAHTLKQCGCPVLPQSHVHTPSGPVPICDLSDCPARLGPHVHLEGQPVEIEPTPPVAEQPPAPLPDSPEPPSRLKVSRKGTKETQEKRVIAFGNAVDALLDDRVPAVSEWQDDTWVLDLRIEYLNFAKDVTPQYAKGVLGEFKEYGTEYLCAGGERVARPFPSFEKWRQSKRSKRK